MAKIEKLKKTVDGAQLTVYPATIPQAVIDPYSGNTVRDELDGLGNSLRLKQDKNLIAEYTHSINKEVAVTSIDLSTGIFTSVNHGLSNGNFVNPVINKNINIENIYPQNYFPTGLFPRPFNYYVVNSTKDTFQISTALNGDPEVFTANESMDLSKWHFEVTSASGINFVGLPDNLKEFHLIIQGTAVRLNNLFININGNNSPYYLATADKIYHQTSSRDFKLLANAIHSVSDVMVTTTNYTRLNIETLQSLMVVGQQQIDTTVSKLNLVSVIPIESITSIYVKGIFPSNGLNIKIYRL